MREKVMYRRYHVAIQLSLSLTVFFLSLSLSSYLSLSPLLLPLPDAISWNESDFEVFELSVERRLIFCWLTVDGLA